MILLEILNPRPVPFPGPLVVKKGNISLAAIALGMPGPESVTAIDTLELTSDTSTVIHFVSSFARASIELLNKLIRTCEI